MPRQRRRRLQRRAATCPASTATQLPPASVNRTCRVPGPTIPHLSRGANGGWLVGGLPPALLREERRLEMPVTAGQTAAALQLDVEQQRQQQMVAVISTALGLAAAIALRAVLRSRSD